MPTYVCPCGQRFAGKGSAGGAIACGKCGRRLTIPGSPPSPPAPLLSADLLDELNVEQQPSVEDSPSLLSASSQKQTRSRQKNEWQTTSISIDWSQFIPFVVGMLLLLTAGTTIIIVAPSVWKMATTAPAKQAKESKVSPVQAEPAEPSWKDTYFNDNIYRLPNDTVDHPNPPQALTGVPRRAGAHPIEQGLELRIDVSKFQPTTESPVYSLASSKLTGAKIDSESGILLWKAPLDFPCGIYDVLVQRSFADMRSDPGLLLQVQVLPSSGPPPRVGMLAPEEPLQTKTVRKPFKFRGSRILPLADYSITAVVLSSKVYQEDQEAYVSPLDLALGWGCMSDESVLRHMQVSQATRRFMYSYSGYLEQTQDELNRSAANVHIIPSSRETALLLASVQRGDLVRLTGVLVEVKRDYWHWKSSLTRDDIGDGACEVMWVDHAEILEE